MIELILAITITCKSVIIENKSNYPWNLRDEEVMLQAKKRCVYHFKDLPCLARFVKVGEHDYHALCGLSKEQE